MEVNACKMFLAQFVCLVVGTQELFTFLDYIKTLPASFSVMSFYQLPTVLLYHVLIYLTRLWMKDPIIKLKGINMVEK